MLTDKKMSQFTEVSALDSTGEIVIIQGAPIDNHTIKIENFKDSIGITSINTGMTDLQNQIDYLDQNKVDNSDFGILVDEVRDLEQSNQQKAEKSTRIIAGVGLTGGGDLSGDVTLNHYDVSSTSDIVSTGNTNGTVVQNISVNLDTFGHTTGTSVGTYNLDNRYYTETEIDSNLVHKSGDTMTGTLTSPTFIKTGGNSNQILVADGSTIDKTMFSNSGHTHYSLYQPNGSNPFVYTDNSGSLHIDGNIIQNGTGYTTHMEQIYTDFDYIYLRSGATSGLGNGKYAGFEAIKYDGLNNGRLVFDNEGVARVGDVGFEQPLATRNENTGMTNGYLVQWDGVNYKLVTSSASTTTLEGKYVQLTGNTTISGVKTFSSSPVVPTPSNGTDAVNKDYVTNSLVNSVPASTVATHPEITFYTRVSGDSGTVNNRTLLLKMYTDRLKQLSTCAQLINPEIADKERTSGTTVYVKKVYDLSANNNDQVNTTDGLTQVYCGGFIAPNELKCLKTLDLQQKFTQTAIPANTTTGFTITTVLNSFGQLGFNSNQGVYIDSSVTFMRLLPNGTLGFYNSTVGSFNANHTSNYLIRLNETNIITWVVDSNSIRCFINEQQAVVTGTFTGFSGTVSNFLSSSSSLIGGKIYHHEVHTVPKSASEIISDHKQLRSIYPYVETVPIGYQEWASSNFDGTVDNLGNNIQQVTGSSTDSNPELGTNGTYEGGLFGVFDNPTGGAVATYTGNTISPISGTTDGRMICSVAGTSSTKPSIQFNGNNNNMIIGQTYRIMFDYKVNSGTCICVPRYGAGNCMTQTLTGTGTYTGYCTSTLVNTAIGYIQFDGRFTFDVQLDNISIKEVGWSDGTNIYNNRIAAGDAVDVAERAAAMWKYYNNDITLGSVYGKYYNWYATKMLDRNPPKSFKIPTSADLTQLQSFVLSGSTGLRTTGLTHWKTPNTGSTNNFGFSMLPSGYIDAAGNSVIMTENGYLYASDVYFGRTIYNNTGFTIAASSKDYGFPIRLLKMSPIGPDSFEATTGNFTTNIASGVNNKDLIVPFGYTVKEVKVITANNLTSFSCNLLNTAGTLQNNLLTNKVATAGTNVSFIVLADQNVQYTNPILRFNCVGNSTGGMEIKVKLEKNVF